MLFILCLTTTVFAQKNEIVTLIGTAPNGPNRNNGDVFQLKLEQSLMHSLSIQTGIRYQNELQHRLGIYSETSKFIQQTYNSYKFDLSLLFIPINTIRFKLKTGFGFDIGASEYTSAARGYITTIPTPDGEVINEYWQYNIENIIDYGMHFILVSNYYLKNNLFFSTEILFDQVFNEEKFSPNILRKSTISLNAGIGFCF